MTVRVISKESKQVSARVFGSGTAEFAMIVAVFSNESKMKRGAAMRL